jgi:hypothetical protein
MKKVYEAKDPLNASLLTGLLNDAGIEALVQGERMSGLLGSVPPVCPSVYVRDEDQEAARSVVAEFERVREGRATLETWTCPKCGEKIEASFKTCWKCEAGELNSEQEGEDLFAEPEGPGLFQRLAKVQRSRIGLILAVIPWLLFWFAIETGLP